MPSPPVRPAPGSPSSLRDANQRRVLDLLRTREEPAVEQEEPAAPAAAAVFTQAELARATGLAPATVSNIVRDLGAAGLVEVLPGSGRRGSSVRLASRAAYVVGIDFGHSHVAVAVGDLLGAPLCEERVGLAEDLPHDRALATAQGLLDTMLATLPPAPTLHLVLGLPAPITDDAVGSPAIFPGWEGVDAREVAQAALGLPVTVENDANLGALAEHRTGAARGNDSCVYVKISSGVGAGVVLGSEIFRGAAGFAGEIGHLTLDEQGPMCRCGSRGCLEAYASSGPILALMAGQQPGATLDDIIAAADEGSSAARRTFEDAGLHLGWGLASIVNLLNPHVLVIGGDLARAGDLLLEPARVGLRRHTLDAVSATPVRRSAHGSRASLLGALLLAAESTDLLADRPAPRGHAHADGSV